MTNHELTSRISLKNLALIVSRAGRTVISIPVTVEVSAAMPQVYKIVQAAPDVWRNL